MSNPPPQLPWNAAQSSAPAGPAVNCDSYGAEASQGERDYAPDPFTSRFATSSILGSKRAVEGRYAHTIENVKAVRQQKGRTNPPSLRLSELYERDLHVSRKRHLRNYASQTASQPASMQTIPSEQELSGTHGRDIPNRDLAGRTPPQSTTPAFNFTYPPPTPTPPDNAFIQEQVKPGSQTLLHGDNLIEAGPSNPMPLEPLHPEIVQAITTVYSILNDTNAMLTEEQARKLWIGMDKVQQHQLFEMYANVCAQSRPATFDTQSEVGLVIHPGNSPLFSDQRPHSYPDILQHSISPQHHAGELSQPMQVSGGYHSQGQVAMNNEGQYATHSQGHYSTHAHTISQPHVPPAHSDVPAQAAGQQNYGHVIIPRTAPPVIPYVSRPQERHEDGFQQLKGIEFESLLSLDGDAWPHNDADRTPSDAGMSSLNEKFPPLSQQHSHSTEQVGMELDLLWSPNLPLVPQDNRPTTQQESASHTPLSLMEDVNVERSLDKGKGRAVDQDPTTPRQDAFHGEQTRVTDSEMNLHQRPNASSLSTSEYLDPGVTLVFVRQIQGLADIIHEQAQTSKELAQEFREFREEFASRPDAAGSSTSQGPQSNSRSAQAQKLHDDSPRKRKRQKRVEMKATRLRGQRAEDADLEDNSTGQQTMDDYTHLRRLKSRVRHLLQQMLNITDWSDVAAMYPTLTNEETVAYKARDPALVCTTGSFRIDFERPWKGCQINAEARAVFIKKYLARAAGGAYAKDPTPPHLLTHETIGKVLDTHMTYCRQRWRRSLEPLPQTKLDKLARQACQRSRKRTLHESREVLLVRRGYTCHLRLFKLLEPINMSGDETDGPVKQHPPKWRIIIAKWQSRRLRDFLWDIDRMYREDWGKPVHKRATGGNPPRERVLRDGDSEDGVAPVGLWRNCYDTEWLEKQPPHIVEELEIVDEDYDFSL